ncbi:hypothetical protein [Streptomyces sp. NPDC049944]|uniref:hypothetical protein n=1 Tax=Streptomyces sp. NPDC049944 TaxID=3155657 RepID=UPI003449824A
MPTDAVISLDSTERRRNRQRIGLLAAVFASVAAAAVLIEREVSIWWIISIFAVWLGAAIYMTVRGRGQSTLTPNGISFPKGTSTRYTGYEYRQAEKLRQEKELKHKQYLNKLEALRNRPEGKPWYEDTWNSVSGFIAEHSDSIKAGIGVLAFGTCIVASAGTCLVVAVGGLSMSAALDQNSGVDTTTTEYRTQTGFLFGVTVAGVGGATWLTRGG